LTDGVQNGLVIFINTYYASGNDILTKEFVYRDPLFDPNDTNTFSHLNASENVSFVLWDVSDEHTEDYPVGMLRIRYSCNISLVRKSANQWDVSNKRNRVLSGSTVAPYMNSSQEIMVNLASFFQQNKLTDDTSVQVSFWQRITRIEAPIIHKDFVVVTGRFEALSMQSNTLSITPV
jgi:hypothetical protein